ncbi:hypothetical protein Tco_1293952 [Tanacetum coccineum]
MPVELGSFDAIIGIDWLAKYQAVIVCAEKIVRIPWRNETLIIHSDGRRANSFRDFPKSIFLRTCWVLPSSNSASGVQIDLVPGVAPVARAPPYIDSAFLRNERVIGATARRPTKALKPSSSPWGAPVLFDFLLRWSASPDSALTIRINHN